MAEQKRRGELQIGQELAPIEYRITPEAVREYADRVDDHNPWYLEKSPFEEPVAHPTIITGDYNRLLSANGYPVFGVVPTGSAHQFFNPIPQGKLLKVSGKIVDKYERRGRNYYIIECMTVDEDGLEIVRSRHTELLT